MKVSELSEQTGWQVQGTAQALSRNIEGVYIGDLLSWVMGKGQPSSAWITVQAHMNILAVASLREFSCIIIAEGAVVTDEVYAKALEENIAILCTQESIFECAKMCIALGV